MGRGDNEHRNESGRKTTRPDRELMGARMSTSVKNMAVLAKSPPDVRGCGRPISDVATQYELPSEWSTSSRREARRPHKYRAVHEAEITRRKSARVFLSAPLKSEATALLQRIDLARRIFTSWNRTVG
jgi:hypothetical protein